jgi:D-3-phosphoglycerate dehydrogenase
MSFRGNQLFGKTLGIIGYGRLGRIMARYGKSLGMKVVACDPYVKTKEINLVSLEELLKTSDVISLHVLLTDSNKGFIKQNHFKMMKNSAYFINTSRAELIEKNALHKALFGKWIAGAGIDVMDDEFSNGSHLKKDPLYKYAKSHNNLIIVPHIGGATFEAMHITEEFIAQEVVKYIKLKKLK